MGGGMSDSKTEALQIAHAALTKASGWLQGEYAKDPDGARAKVAIAVNDALGEVSRVLRLHEAPRLVAVSFVGGPWNGETRDIERVITLLPATGGEYWLDVKSDPPSYFWQPT